ncbi:MAG: chromophore lyase CpcT/CpeT [Pseudomonadota bacterium]
MSRSTRHGVRRQLINAWVVWMSSALLVSGCAHVEPPTGDAEDRLNELGALMIGSFSSAKQAATDSQYFDIRLEMVRIWADRTDGIWLYVEQAAASALDRPYRQRVYQVTGDDNDWQSAVFELPEPLQYAGAWKNVAAFERLSPDALSLRTGCAVFLTRPARDHFEGSTRANDCLSSLRGASYATSEVVITPEGITSWDRGYDAEGVQVWGAVVGPYRFDRL